MTMLTESDLLKIGEYTVRIIGTSIMLGHKSPAGSTDYLDRDECEGPWAKLVYDAFRAGRTESDAAESRARLSAFVEEYSICKLLAQIQGPDHG